MICADDGEETYYHFNAHGDVVVLTNESGNKTKSYAYNAFGVEENPSALDDNPFRYCGEYFDKVNEKIYLRARYYDAGQGRFTQEDPIRDGYNWYSYCGGNPVVRVDRNGAFWETLFDIFSLATSVAEVIANPTDPMAWLGMIGDAVDLIPFVSGVGETIEVVDTGLDILRASDRIGDAADATYDMYKASKKMDEIADSAQDAYKASKQMDELVDGAQDAQKAAKKTTNPYGKKGSPEHQKIIEQEKQKLREEGYKVEDKEVQVKTQGGKKNSRYPDITATDPVTGEKSYVQVGKSNTKGPINTYEGAVKRERDAIDDLVNYGGIRREQIRFVTYKQ